MLKALALRNTASHQRVSALSKKPEKVKADMKAIEATFAKYRLEFE